MRLVLLLSFLIISKFSYSQSTVNEYYEFLKTQNQSPKEYIFKLFETNDIIILGERDHRDITQYDLILDILEDDRFIENIGHVYSEIGVVNRTEWGNQVVKGNFKNQKAFDKEFVKLYRELDYTPLWDKYNMIKYLKGVYKINKELQENKKIRIGFTDCAFEWEGMTKEKYKEFEEKYLYGVNTRDSIMALNFASLYEKQIPINGKKKALYIQSRPHAEKIDTIFVSQKIKKVGSYLKDKYTNQVKIVALNWYNWVPAEWQSEVWGYGHKVELSNEGKWDAAFELTENKSVGFSIKNTVFGKTNYDYPYNNPNMLLYEDIIDGIIFYKAFYDFTCTRGIPKVVDREFAKTMIERQIIVGTYNENEKYRIKDEIYDWSDFRTFDCEDYSKMLEQMNKCLKE